MLDNYPDGHLTLVLKTADGEPYDLRGRATGAVIEVCPASNRRIGGILDCRYHPVHRFAQHGLRFVVASDDPGIMGIRLVDEIEWVVQQLGLEEAGRQGLLDAAWSSRSEVLSGRHRCIEKKTDT